MNTTTETVQYTPTPWRKHDTEHDAIVGPDRKAIALVMGRSRTTEEDEANLAFIVRACNNHEALVAFAREVRKHCDGPFAECINVPNLRNMAHDVIKAATQ